MADIEININRFTEVHKQIERARVKLAAVKPAITADATGSLALPAFKQRVDELAALVELYVARVEADSRMIQQIGLRFMDEDDALSQAYRSSMQKTLGNG